MAKALPEPWSLPLPSVPEEERPFTRDPAVAGGFRNPWGLAIQKGPTDLLRWRMNRSPLVAEKTRPPRLPAAPDPLAAWAEAVPGARLQWLGHASVLVEIDGLTVLIDPLFGRAALAPRAAPAPVLPDELPPIDAVMLTHGHYDHLDAPSLRALSRRFGPDLLFVVPRGQGGALPAGVARVELSWWQAVTLGGVDLCLVPAQHWHRRGPFDHDRALWGGVVIRGRRSVYHSGDTGYFGGFRTIGRVFPDLDVAILPLGAYEPRWFMAEQHMAPEQSVLALQELGARLFVGMHWGTFDLTDEPLDHGPFVLLPEAVAQAGLDPRRFQVLGHGGSLSFGDLVQVRGGAGVPGLGDQSPADTPTSAPRL